MYTKDEFKQRFRAMDTEELILNASRPLTDEAMEATKEILAERGYTGDAAREKTKEVIRAHLQGSGVTRNCDYCGATLHGAVPAQGQKFCSHRCRTQSALAVIALDFAPETIAEHARQVRNGHCPRCRRRGDVVEVRSVRRMVSVLILSIEDRYELCCCRGCYEKELKSALIVSGLLGWWSFKGLFANIGVVMDGLESLRRRDAPEPSAALIAHASLDLAQKSLAQAPA